MSAEYRQPVEREPSRRQRFAGPSEGGQSSVALSVLAWLAVLYTLYFAAPILIPVLLAVLLAFVLSPIVRGLQSLHLPRSLAAGIVVFGLVAALGFGLVKLGEPAAEWFSAAPEKLRALEPQLRTLREPVDVLREATSGVEELTELQPADDALEVKVQQRPFLAAALSGTPRVLASGTAAVFFLFFLLAAGDHLTQKVVRVFPRLFRSRDIREVGLAVEAEISGYLLTITLINLGLGALTAGWLWLLGIENAMLWGLLIALFNFAPYIGSVASMILLAVVALLQVDLQSSLVLVVGGYAVLTLIEGQLITPFLVGQRLALSPYVIFLAILLFGWLWGLAGVLMAVPILVCLKIVGSHVPGAGVLASIIAREETEAGPSEPPDRQASGLLRR